MTAQPNKMAEPEWRALGAQLFGKDPTKWRFRCPHCGHVASIALVRALPEDQLQRLRDGDWRPEQECVGRHLAGVGCDWCAYGLLCGPFFVVRGDGKETPVFGFDVGELDTVGGS